MESLFRKAKKYLKVLKSTEFSNVTEIEGITYCHCDYKTGHTPPALSEFTPFENGGKFGTGNDSHAWFHFTVDVPEHMQNKPVELAFRTDFDRFGVTTNPQFILYVNGKLCQGMDTRHKEYMLSGGTSFDIYVYAYTFTHIRVPLSPLPAFMRNIAT